jgi:hypothetical protein
MPGLRSGLVGFESHGDQCRQAIFDRARYIEKVLDVR